ncbi:hypothetical protein N7449_008976 [Penicillium cf. viridicatum]|uniref:Uncharacterized protein n=1 Tax=Penicillium cf. viridicatum TaxID=2972119 RepID=A0A9W9M8N0_9EURO|nr:hypothetical protein N7449_008976 [Penicillium cf. viridicatum]
MESDSFELSSLDQTIWHNYYGLDSLSFKIDNPDTAALELQAAVDQLFQALPFLASEVIFYPQLGDKRSLKKLKHSHTLNNEYPICRVVSHARKIEEVRPSTEYSALPLLHPLSRRQVVVRFQANVLTDGLLLCMNFNHCILDGTGAVLVLQQLAGLCRQDPSIKSHLSGTLIDETLTRKKLNSVDIPPAPASVRDSSPPESFGTEPDTLLTRIFKISNQKLDHLKDQCQRHLDTVGNSGFLSRNDILSALLVLLVKKAKVKTNGIHEVALSMPVNLRAKQPEYFPAGYMGNSFATLHIQTKVDIMSSTSAICQIALEIRRQIKGVDQCYVKDMLGKLNHFEDYAQYPWRPFDLELSSWRGLPIYDLDFGRGLGKVVDYYGNSASHDGGAFVLPVKNLDLKHADWEVSLTLGEDTMRRFSQDPMVLSLTGESPYHMSPMLWRALKPA